MKNKFRRKYGVHLTSKELFRSFILPEINKHLQKYIWVDLFAGEGNLILPILDNIEFEKRIDFFKDHMYLYDINKEMVNSCIQKAQSYGIPKRIATKNIVIRDNLLDFPSKLLYKDLPVYHITNPPYLYLGYIKKHKETQSYIKYFEGINKGYQDLYQIAMINDLRNNITNIVYIIPSNFLFGSSVSNKFRIDFLKHYKIIKMFIFERKVFEYTGTNICIGFFKKKSKPNHEIQQFSGLKYKKEEIIAKGYKLDPKSKYRSGAEFKEFTDFYKIHNSLDIEYYLMNEDVNKNKGGFTVEVIDANKYQNNQYLHLLIQVDEDLLQRIKSNILYVRTVDTGSDDGKAGLGIIKEDLGVDGILVTGNTYRTHPIQIFLEPSISKDTQLVLKEFVNLMLSYFRKKLDGEFLTTYKYSKARYTRKYLGLTQVKRLIKTFPYDLSSKNFNTLKNLISEQNVEEILKMLKNLLLDTSK